MSDHLFGDPAGIMADPGGVEVDGAVEAGRRAWLWTGMAMAICAQFSLPPSLCYRMYTLGTPLCPQIEYSGSVALLSTSRLRPDLGQHLCLFKHRLGSLLPPVRRVAILAEDALHQHPEMSADVVADRPVDGHILADSIDQFAGNHLEGVVAKDLDGAVVGLQGVVECQFITGQPQLLTSRAGSA
jgi:hypothetical protein